MAFRFEFDPANRILLVALELLPGVGKRSDRQLFEVLCRMLNKMRQGTIRIMEVNALVSLAGQFAMSPSARSKVTTDAEPSSALTRFFNAQKSQGMRLN
jgi:hypothetical protein